MDCFMWTVNSIHVHICLECGKCVKHFVLFVFISAFSCGQALFDLNTITIKSISVQVERTPLFPSVSHNPSIFGNDFKEHGRMQPATRF